MILKMDSHKGETRSQKELFRKVRILNVSYTRVAPEWILGALLPCISHYLSSSSLDLQQYAYSIPPHVLHLVNSNPYLLSRPVVLHSRVGLQWVAELLLFQLEIRMECQIEGPIPGGVHRYRDYNVIFKYP